MHGLAIFSARVSQSDVDNLYKQTHGVFRGNGGIWDDLVVAFQMSPKHALQFPDVSSYVDLGHGPFIKDRNLSRQSRDGPVSATTYTLPAGRRQITVEYRGGNYRDSTSNAVLVTVLPVTDH